jgi:hypothetical protein
LVTGAGAGAAELLGLASTGIRDKKGAVVLYKNFLNFSLGCLIDV